MFLLVPAYPGCPGQTAVKWLLLLLLLLEHFHHKVPVGIVPNFYATKGRGFDSRSFHFQLTTLGKLFAHMCLCHQAV